MITTTLLLLAFALIHSVTASVGFKERIKKGWGEKAYQTYYTLLYNLISVLTIVPVLWAARLPSVDVWHLSGFPGLVFLFVQLVGVSGIVFSLYQVDPLHFVGVRQLSQNYSLNRNQKSNELMVSGVY